MKTFYILVLFLFVLSCKKDDSIKFSGITETDQMGNSIGNIDETDWRTDDVWDNKVNDLFENESFGQEPLGLLIFNNKSIESVLPSLSNIAINHVYPNPAVDNINIYAHVDSTVLKMILVDENFEKLNVFKSNRYGTISYSINVSDFELNKIYRIYYMFEFKNGEVKKGHGDIKKVNSYY